MEQELLDIINHYGIMPQLKYIHSEYFELDEAIMKYESAGFDFSNEECIDIEEEYKNHIAEEIADVMVMLEQFGLYYGINVLQINEIMKKKIERQLKRIEVENDSK